MCLWRWLASIVPQALSPAGFPACERRIYPAIPIAVAKAIRTSHFSELVDQAEHHGRRTLILRHGKPAAAIVPVSLVEDARPKPMTKRQVEALLKRAGRSGDPSFDAGADLLAGRR
jgi:prevent-host-death family protein